MTFDDWWKTANMGRCYSSSYAKRRFRDAYETGRASTENIKEKAAMRKYRKKPVVIEAMTWDELVQYGIDNGGNVVNGLPWSFQINGRPVTHDCQGGYDRYLISTLEGQMEMTRDDMCIIGIKGEAYPCKRDIFEASYEEVAE